MSRTRRLSNALGAAFLSLVALELILRGAGFVLASATEGSATGERPTILCVGDSFTQGWTDGRYPEMLDESLVERGLDYDVVNLGVAGSNSSQALARTIGAFDRYPVALLIVKTGNNDCWNLSDSAYWQFEEGRLSSSEILAARARIALHSVRIYRLGKTLWQMAAGGPLPNEFSYREPEEKEHIDRSLAVIDHDVHRRQLEYNLTKFVELSRLHRVPLVFQTYFHFHGFHVNEIIREVAARHEVPVVDNNFLFHQRIAEEDRPAYVIPDGHPSPRGYRFVADNVLAVLEEQGMIPDP